MRRLTRILSVALLLGSEGDGLSRAALGASDTVVTIPMGHGVNSLNVAAASAVALYALASGTATGTRPAVTGLRK